jgi:hypothetical protein
MRDFDPIDREPRFSDPPLRRDDMMVERESGLTTLGIIFALAVDHRRRLLLDRFRQPAAGGLEQRTCRHHAGNAGSIKDRQPLKDQG